jgi:hypothetical protein
VIEGRGLLSAGVGAPATKCLDLEAPPPTWDERPAARGITKSLFSFTVQARLACALPRDDR